jgi:tRNA(Arg) A34 adenosine deaminase TadA
LIANRRLLKTRIGTIPFIHPTIRKPTETAAAAATDDDTTTTTTKMIATGTTTPKSPPPAEPDAAAGVVAVVTAPPRTSPTLTAVQIGRMLEVIRNDILPLTKRKVAMGNKMFGAAILENLETMRLLHADTNDEITCPLFHGEVKCIYAWSQQQALAVADRRTIAGEAVFLSTHEPCCMCISSILWSGFHTVYYLFSYETTKAQGIPYDIETMHELWGVHTYRKRNKFLTSVCLLDCIHALPDDNDEKTALQQQVATLVIEYDQISQAQDVTSAVSS